LGLRPKPHPLFAKSGAKTLTLRPKIARMRDFKSKFCSNFFKSLQGVGRSPTVFMKIDFRDIANHRALDILPKIV
jgi:hypothetical protein